MNGRQTVSVWGQPHTVNIRKTLQDVWIAEGHYLGEPLAVEGETESAAVRRWAEVAGERQADFAKKYGYLD